LCRDLSVSAGKVDSASVDLDAEDDALALQEVDEWSAIIGLLVECLVVENDSTDVFGEFLAGVEQQLSVDTTIFLDVFNPDCGKTFANGA